MDEGECLTRCFYQGPEDEPGNVLLRTAQLDKGRCPAVAAATRLPVECCTRVNDVLHLNYGDTLGWFWLRLLDPGTPPVLVLDTSPRLIQSRCHSQERPRIAPEASLLWQQMCARGSAAAT